ncbi:MAG: AI-2E family transporter [Planctomycetia bacterium]|nr:AI-2E family transporter [Planctomycetia bacterium]
MREQGEPVQEADGWASRERLLVVVLLVVTAIVFGLCVALARPFLPALAWALALAVVAHPVHRSLSRRLTHQGVAAGISVVLVALLLIVPAVLVAQRLVTEAAHGVSLVRAQTANGAWRARLDEYPQLTPVVQWLEGNVDLQSEAPRAVTALFGDVASLLGGSIWAVVQLLLVLFILFYFFRDGPELLRGLRRLVPLSHPETDQVMQRVADTIHATIYGSLLVALIQGSLGGLMFWLLGLPAPVVWGAIMALLAVVPYLGTFVVWAPTAVLLALTGDLGRAAILAGWGAIAIGFIDNLLYPIFVGNRLRQHTLLAFLALLGGLSFFGAAGLILGPVILALALALVDIWRRRTAGGRSAEEEVQPSDVKEARQEALPTANGAERPAAVGSC